MKKTLKDYSLIIWDWNGTLYDDADYCYEISQDLFQKRGIEYPGREQHQKAFCHPIKNYYQKIGLDFNVHSYEEIAADFVQAYEENAHSLCLRDSTEVLLAKVNDLGIDQVVLSAAPKEYLAKNIERLGLTAYFSHIIGQDDHYGHGKLGTALHWKAQYDIQTHTALLIGDTNHDFEVACELGADCFLIPAGYQHQENLKECNTQIINNLEELLQDL